MTLAESHKQTVIASLKACIQQIEKGSKIAEFKCTTDWPAHEAPTTTLEMTLQDQKPEIDSIVSAFAKS